MRGLPDDVSFKYSPPPSVYEDHPDSIIADEDGNRLERCRLSENWIEQIKERDKRLRMEKDKQAKKPNRLGIIDLEAGNTKIGELNMQP